MDVKFVQSLLRWRLGLARIARCCKKLCILNMSSFIMMQVLFLRLGVAAFLQRRHPGLVPRRLLQLQEKNFLRKVPRYQSEKW